MILSLSDYQFLKEKIVLLYVKQVLPLNSVSLKIFFDGKGEGRT